MICNKQTMLKGAIGLLLAAGIAYVALPEFRSWIVAAAPTLLFLLCPLSMLACMIMNGQSGQNGQNCQPSPSPDKDVTANAASKADAKGT